MVSLNNLDKLNERELVAKANKVLGKMKEGHDLGPEGMRMVGESKLKKGGMIYELNDAKVEKCLRGEKAVFAENLMAHWL